MLPATGGSNRECKLVGVFRRRFARAFELLPVRRVLERLGVLCKRLFALALFQEHIAPCFQRIGPVRPALVRVLELRFGTGEIAVLQERDAPGELRRRQIRGKCDGVRVSLLRA